MTTDNFCFYLQNSLIQTCQTGGQWYINTRPLVFPALAHGVRYIRYGDENVFITLTLDQHQLLVSFIRRLVVDSKSGAVQTTDETEKEDCKSFYSSLEAWDLVATLTVFCSGLGPRSRLGLLS